MLPAISDSAALIAKWERILEVRQAALKGIEERRELGEIGSSLQADVVVGAGKTHFDALASLGDDLRFVLITSSAKVEHRDADGFELTVTRAPHAKCERCWHYRADVGRDPAYPTLCGRCVSNLFGPGEPRSFA